VRNIFCVSFVNDMHTQKGVTKSQLPKIHNETFNIAFMGCWFKMILE
jgi:hypothetical protein